MASHSTPCWQCSPPSQRYFSLSLTPSTSTAQKSSLMAAYPIFKYNHPRTLHQRRSPNPTPHQPPYPISDSKPFSPAFSARFPWARNTNLFNETQTIWRPASYYLANSSNIKPLPLDTTAEIPPAILFVRGLISLELDDLEEGGERGACPVRLESYRQKEKGSGDRVKSVTKCRCSSPAHT